MNDTGEMIHGKQYEKAVNVLDMNLHSLQSPLNHPNALNRTIETYDQMDIFECRRRYSMWKCILEKKNPAY